MLKFWSVINCIFVHWTKKLTLVKLKKIKAKLYLLLNFSDLHYRIPTVCFHLFWHTLFPPTCHGKLSLSDSGHRYPKNKMDTFCYPHNTFFNVIGYYIFRTYLAFFIFISVLATLLLSTFVIGRTLYQKQPELTKEKKGQIRSAEYALCITD